MEAIFTRTMKTYVPSSTNPAGATGEASRTAMRAITTGVAASSSALDGLRRRCGGAAAGGTHPALILDSKETLDRNSPAISGGTPGSTTTPTFCPGTLAPPTLVMCAYYVPFRQSVSLRKDSPMQPGPPDGASGT